jgi:RimJ/RimL family protein N-acetyltransferase
VTPRLETPRLVLRGRVIADFPDYLALWKDPAVLKHLSARPFTREELWAKFGRQSGLWALIGYGYWLVEEKASGAVVGEVGLADMKRDMDPPLDGLPEYGWVMSGRVHGKGYATEAVTAALAWGDEKFGRAKFSAIIDPKNEPSLRVAEKCGFREARRSDYKGAEVVVLIRG